MAHLERVLRVVLITLVAAMTIIVFAAVLGRYFFAFPLPWAGEVTRYMFIYTVFLGAAVGVRHRMHVRLDLWRSGSAVERVTGNLAQALVTVLLVVLMYYGWQLVMNTMNQRSPAVGMPIGLVYLAIPLGALLSLVFLWGPKADKIEGQAA